jgi:hypothetical protein
MRPQLDHASGDGAGDGAAGLQGLPGACGQVTTTDTRVNLRLRLHPGVDAHVHKLAEERCIPASP